jgi:hypothetical protein
MNHASRDRRHARHAKLERRRLATFSRPRNEKPPRREPQGFDFDTPASVVSKPSRKGRQALSA